MARTYKRDSKGKFSRGGSVRGVASKAKKKYQKGHSGPGAIHRRRKDYYNSTGAYATSRKGKPVGKTLKKSRKAASVIAFGNPGYAAVSAGSYARHKRSTRGAKVKH